MKKRLDTLDMVGDGDDLDILEDIEATFGISINDVEAISMRTVGDLHRVVAGKLELAQPTTACFSQIAFHRLRRASEQIGAAALELRPSDDVSRLFADCRTNRDRRRRWTELERCSGLTLPSLETPGTDKPSVFQALHPFLIGISMAFATAVLFGAFADLLGGWAVAGIAGGVIFSMVLIGRVRATVSPRVKTIGDLAEEAAGASFKTLYAEKRSCHPKDIWFAIVAQCRASTGFRDEIRPTTSFFASHALNA